MLTSTAGAQIRLPTLPLPSLPLQGTASTLNTVESRAGDRLNDLRHLEITALYNAHRDVIDLDPQGEPIVRGEILALSPTDSALERARAGGFEVAPQSITIAPELRLVVLKAPAGLSTRKALERMRREDPTGSYDFNHIYSASGEEAPSAGEAVAPSLPVVSADESHATGRIGLIDSGLDVHHPTLRGGVIHAWGCHERAVPAAHGTAIASILIGRDSAYRGISPDAELFAADVYCGEPTGGSVESLIAALAWLAEMRVPVINVSLVGGRNLLLERVVAGIIGQGVIIVAAVGNDGPAAPPLYPASYPGVVGVTGVDARRQVLIEAARGPQVMFAAPGADVAAAKLDGNYISVRGTSYAAPFVTGLLAKALSTSAPGGAANAVAQLAQTAVHLGPAGRNLTYGLGLVGEAYRIDPARISAARP
jgi:hypothetical protein